MSKEQRVIHEIANQLGLISQLEYDLTLVKDALDELKTLDQPLPACKQLDKKHFKAYRKAFKTVLRYYGWKP